MLRLHAAPACCVLRLCAVCCVLCALCCGCVLWLCAVCCVLCAVCCVPCAVSVYGGLWAHAVVGAPAAVTAWRLLQAVIIPEMRASWYVRVPSMHGAPTLSVHYTHTCCAYCAHCPSTLLIDCAHTLPIRCCTIALAAIIDQNPRSLCSLRAFAPSLLPSPRPVHSRAQPFSFPRQDLSTPSPRPVHSRAQPFSVRSRPMFKPAPTPVRARMADVPLTRCGTTDVPGGRACMHG